MTTPGDSKDGNPQEAAVSSILKLWREGTLEQKSLTGQRSHSTEIQLPQDLSHPKNMEAPSDEDLADTPARCADLLVLPAAQRGKAADTQVSKTNKQTDK